MRIGKYIIGLLSGLTFGFLFAPKEGKKLRKEIAKHGMDNAVEGLKILGDAYKDAWKDVSKEMQDLKDNEQVEAMLEMSKEKIRNFLDDAQDQGYEMASKAQEKFESFAEMAKQKAVKAKGHAKKKVVSKLKKAKKAFKK